MPAAHANRTTRRIVGRALPVALVMGVLAALAIAATGCGEDKRDGRGPSAPEATATKPAATSTPAPPTPTNEQVLAFLIAIAPTPAPAPAGGATGGGGGGGGGGAPAQAGAPYVPRPSLSGPGPITGTAWTLSIPRIGVNASIYGRTVGGDGQMGNPAGAWDVIWYDFSSWGGLGGAPGEAGSNVVLAGHVDYIRVGPAVFWSIKDLAPGDQVTVNTPNGPITYAIQWSQWAGPYDDFTSYVARQGQDVVTIVTCIGGFSGGHYTNRLVVRGVRI